jgi:hypothetical protein
MRLNRVINYLAQSALAPGQIVKFGNADGTVTQAVAAADNVIGIVTSPVAVAIGDRVDVARDGLPNVIFGGVVTRGDLLSSDANGHAITAVSPARIIGVAEVSAVANDIGEILIDYAKI